MERSDILNALKEARNYVPIAEKQAFISACATKCIDTVRITADGGVPAPDRYKVNVQRKDKYLLCALARLYLKLDIETEGEDPWLLSDAQYDTFAGMHLEGEIQRAKGDASLRDRCFDLLGDYRSLRRRFDEEIVSLLAALNDPISRIASFVYTIATPERMERMISEIGTLLEQHQAENPKTE